MAAILFLAMSLVWGGVVALLTLMVTFFGDIYARPIPPERSSRPGGRRADDGFVAPVVPEPVSPYVPPTPELPREPAVAEHRAFMAEPALDGNAALNVESGFDVPDTPAWPHEIRPDVPYNPYAEASVTAEAPAIVAESAATEAATYYAESTTFTTPTVADTGLRGLYQRPPTT